jgi:predicted helicase
MMGEDATQSNQGGGNIKKPSPMISMGEGATSVAGEGNTFGPEDIMAYIYSVLHSNKYRKRYFEFLKIDFPRIQFFDVPVFAQLSMLGAELIGHHLLKIPYQLEVSKEDKGVPKVEKVEYNKESKKLYINPTYYFEHIEPEVWEFEIGGYQVLSKWLKERKGSTLDYKDIDHVKNIAKSLGHTIRIMSEIDKVFCQNGIFAD